MHDPNGGGRSCKGTENCRKIDPELNLDLHLLRRVYSIPIPSDERFGFPEANLDELCFGTESRKGGRGDRWDAFTSSSDALVVIERIRCTVRRRYGAEFIKRNRFAKWFGR